MNDPSATQVFYVENNTDEPAAVQVSAETWTMDSAGVETNASAEQDFVIFPAQVVLKPHESRAVRVQYVGTPAAQEKAYRLIAEQLPVDLEKTPQAGSAVKFMLKFKAALYVTPPEARSQLSVFAEEMADRKLRLTIKNSGQAHTLLRAPVVTLTMDNGTSAPLSGDALKPIEGENIHAGATRVFDVPAVTRGRVVSARITAETAF